MASTAEIRGRINSIKKTRKITNAMYLIASTKLQKANRKLEGVRPYFENLLIEKDRILTANETIESPYYSKDRISKDEKYGILVITSDKGLCGAYNLNIIKDTLRHLEQNPNAVIFVVGEYGRNYFKNRNIPIVEDFVYSPENPTLETAKEMASVIFSEFDKGKLKRVICIYTEMNKSHKISVKSTRLMPFESMAEETPSEIGDIQGGAEFFPSANDIFDVLVKSLVHGLIFASLVESYASEQQSRMEAMENANENADELLSALSLQYNRARQAAITMEITEVSAGALAQRKK